MPWDSVEVGLAGGDETVNFGPRNETGSSLYQVDTLASVSPGGDEVPSVPHFLGASSQNGFSLVTSSQVIIFTSSCSDVQATLNFESEIDCVAWSADALFLGIGERSGTFHFLHTASRQILFSQDLGATGNLDCRKSRTFLSMVFTTPKHGDPCNLVILSSSGILTEFSNLYLEKLHEAIVGGKFDLVKELRGLSQVQCVDVGVVHQEMIAGVTVGFLWGAPVLITYGAGDAAIAMWSSKQHSDNDGITLVDSISSYILGGSGIVKASASGHGHFLTVLDDKNMLSLWDIESLTMIAFWSHLTVDDFLLLCSSSVQTPGTSKTDDEFKLVVLTTTTKQTQYLQIYSFPAMKQMYSLEIYGCSILAECPSTQESIYFIEGVQDGMSGSDELCISSLRIRSLTEALPENRLSRFLHKQKFDKAEMFARQFNLSIELVFKVKANWLLDKVSPWSYDNNQAQETPSTIDDFSLDELIDCLTKIKDNEYVCKCCLQAALPSLEETFNLLSYTRKRISMESSSHGQKESPCGTPSHLLTEVLQALDRLATYEMAYGVEMFRGSEWQLFLSADLLAEMNKCLLSGKVMSAVIIWRRHQSQFKAHFSLEKLESLLGSICQGLPSSRIIPWLQDDLVPFVSKVLPEGLKLLALWLEQRAREMELSEKEGWPRNALQLASVLLSASKGVSGSAVGRGLATPAQFVDQVCGLPATARALLNDSSNNLNVSNELASLMNLVQLLTDLVDLHTKYSCRITLAEFAQETTSTIVFRLLDRVVAAELVPSAIAKYIAPYMVHHSLDRDTMLLQYIEDLFNRGTGSYSSLSNSLWEARVIAVISCIKNKEVRCKATLEVMRHAMIPWSDSVEKLVTEFMAAYPNDMNLKEQYRLVELKKMLSQYGMRSFHVSYASRARATTRYILTRDDPNAMEDALKVVAAYSHITEEEAYVFRLQKLCLDNKVPACLELLESASLQRAEQFGHELLTWLCGILEEEHCDDVDETPGKIIAAEAGVAVLKFMRKHNLSSLIDVDSVLQTLRMISALQKEFGLFLSVEEYQMPGVRKELFERYLHRYLGHSNSRSNDGYGEKEDPEKTGRELLPKEGDVNLTKLFRLSELIGVPKDTVRRELALRFIASGDTSSALDMCRELIKRAPCESTAYTLYKVALNLCEQLAEGNNTVTDSNKNIYDVTYTIYELLCEASTYCSPDLLCDCAELCKLYRLTDCIYSQCESGDYGFSIQSVPQSSNQDPFTEWTFGQRFKEDGLVLDSFVILPLAAKFTLACFPGSLCADERVPYYQTRVAGRRQPSQESKSVESGETSVHSSYLMRTSAAGLNVIRYLQENSLSELALRYLVETLGLCLHHFAANDMIHTEKEEERGNSVEKQRLVKISMMGTKMIHELTAGLLKKVFNCRTVDHDLGLGYLCSIPKQNVLQHFLGQIQSCTKLLAFAKVGLDFAQLCKEPGVLTKCQEIATNASWGIKLASLKMSLKDVCKTDKEEKLSLLPELMQKPNIGLDMILEYCRAFHLDEDNALLTYVKLQLLPPTPSPGINSPLSAPHDETEEISYEQNIRKVAHRISCTSSLLDLLVEVGSKVDPYDYNRIAVILKLVKELSRENSATVEKGIQLLDYLYQYERKALPTNYERCFQHLTKNSEVEKATLQTERPLSSLSKVRLPYHPLLYGDPWKVLAPELSEETVPKLLGISKLLKLSSDQMYLTAIRNLATIPSGANGPSDICDPDGSAAVMDAGGPGQLAKTFSCEKAKNMLYCVRRKEMAIAAAKWIAQQLPLGEEKIDILRTCVDLAANWKSSCPQEDEKKANTTYNRLSELCRAVATEHVLHKFSIASPSAVSMAGKPAKLICELYETYGARDPAMIHQPPDIHKATKEVAIVNNCKIEKIRIYLIEKWLPSSRQSPGGDSEFTSSGDEIEDSEEDEQNLKRVIYLMHSSDQESAVRFLLNLANKTGSSFSHITSNCRVRALRALFAMAPGETIERLCTTPISTIRQQMQALVCLAELEGLHIQQSASAFDKCNKEGLVRGLWRNHKHEKKAVRLVADLCLDNNIHDPQLWNSVVQQLLAFGMIKYLRRVLVNLAGISDLWQVRCLPQVWRSVLMAPFKSVSTPLSDEETAACEESASLLQRCPLLLDLDVYSIAVQFHKVGLQAHSLTCLLLIPSSTTRQQYIRALLETNCAIRVLTQLDEQRERGRTLSQADIVEREVFRFIEEKQEYEVLLNTAYFDKFLRYLISTKNISGILLKTIQANRLENAKQLVRVYHQAHPNLPSSEYVASNQISGFDELWVFLEMHGLLEASLPFLPNLETSEEHEEEPTVQQTQLEETELTVDQTEDQQEHFSLMLTADYSVEFPL